MGNAASTRCDAIVCQEAEGERREGELEFAAATAATRGVEFVFPSADGGASTSEEEAASRPISIIDTSEGRETILEQLPMVSQSPSLLAAVMGVGVAAAPPSLPVRSSSLGPLFPQPARASSGYGHILLPPARSASGPQLQKGGLPSLQYPIGMWQPSTMPCASPVADQAVEETTAPPLHSQSAVQRVEKTERICAKAGLDHLQHRREKLQKEWKQIQALKLKYDAFLGRLSTKDFHVVKREDETLAKLELTNQAIHRQQEEKQKRRRAKHDGTSLIYQIRQLLV